MAKFKNDVVDSYYKKYRTHATSFAKKMLETDRPTLELFDKANRETPYIGSIIGEKAYSIAVKKISPADSSAEEEIARESDDLEAALIEDYDKAMVLIEDKFKKYLKHKFGITNDKKFNILYNKANNKLGKNYARIYFKFDDLYSFAVKLGANLKQR